MIWLIQALNGVSYGMLLFVLAAGLTISFGMLRAINLAHGAFYLLSGYIALTVVAATNNFWLAMLAGAVSIALLGGVIQHLFLRHFQHNHLAQVLLTFGFAFLLGDLALWQFGGTPQTLPTPEVFEGTTSLGIIRYPIYRLIVIAVGAATGLILWWFVDYTRVGMLVRAAVNDPETAQALGVDVPLFTTGIFALGALLAGAAGVVGGPLLGMYPGADREALLLSIVIVVIGGLGSLRGAFIAAVLIGLIDTAARTLLPELSQFAIFAPMALVLVLRPGGLLGRAV